MKALCDQYGSLIVEEDGYNIFGYAWNSGGVIDDFDNQGSYSSAFALLLETYGYQPVITRFEANGVTFTHDGESVFIYWDADQHDVVPIVSAWTNGEANMFSRVLNDGTADVRVVCDESGKLCTIENSYLVVTNDNEVMSQNDGTKLTALTTAAGGATEINMATAENDMTIYYNGQYSVIVNTDGEIKSGSFDQLILSSKLYEGDEYIAIGNKLVVAQPNTIFKKVNGAWTMISDNALITSIAVAWGADPTSPVSTIDGDSCELIVTTQYTSTTYNLVNGEFTPPIL